MLEKLLRRIMKLLRNIFQIFYRTLKQILFTEDKKNEGWKGTLKTLFYAFLLAMIIRSFLFEPFHIPSGSMKPELLNGDFIFVSKYSYGYSRYSFPLGFLPFEGRVFNKKPERGDVIVFKFPANPRINYIKRLVGFPGDKVQMKKGFLYINEERVQKKYTGRFKEERTNKRIRTYMETLPNGKQHLVLDEKNDLIGDDTQIFIIPKDHYFFLGDNRDNSYDSRFKEGAWLVPEQNLVGKARIIFFSAKENPLKFWKWFSSIRGKRIFKKIN